MRVEVLLSCMNQNDFSIIEKSNLKNIKTLVVNQCDIKEDKIIKENNCRLLKTSTRGLSKSRNLAIKNAEEDICLISDDDEFFIDDLENKIIESYENLPQADIIIFKILNHKIRFGDKIKKLKKLDLLKVSSVQISFRVNSIKNKGLSFDENLGSGTGNGSGEENKFLIDCYSKKLKIYYVPIVIGELRDSTSIWFNGFNDKFFFNRGKTTRYTLGLVCAWLYGLYYILKKHKMYKKEISIFNAWKALKKGLKTKDINKTFEEN